MTSMTVREFIATIYNYSPDDIITVAYRPKELTINQVADFVAIGCGYNNGDCLKIHKDKRNEHKLERWLFYVYCRLLTKASLAEIGNHIGLSYHSVYSAINKLRYCSLDVYFERRFLIIKHNLKESGYEIPEEWRRKL